ncbi:MAG TPA: fibronectin type III domain-containing protein, partial [Acidimicrobiales bacterium]|nr:fibronectin type III domain-containing protein [Acidimicrobiales bacterium]
GASLYTNPVGGNQKVFANIAGHRDVEATECPGGGFYATLPQVRAQVAARMGAADTTAPSTPTGLTATGGRRKITLAWTASTDTGSGVAGYEVHRSASAGGPFALLAQSASPGYTDSGVPRGRRYWYQVTAYDAAGNPSPASTTVTAVAT